MKYCVWAIDKHKHYQFPSELSISLKYSNEILPIYQSVWFKSLGEKNLHPEMKQPQV
jgi:hypothetical protein